MATQSAITQGAFHGPLVLQLSSEISFLGATRQILRSSITQFSQILRNIDHNKEIIKTSVAFVLGVLNRPYAVTVVFNLTL